MLDSRGRRLADQAASADPPPKTTSPHEHEFAPHPVAERSERQKQTGHEDGEGVHDPLKLARSGVQAADDRR